MRKITPKRNSADQSAEDRAPKQQQPGPSMPSKKEDDTPTLEASSESEDNNSPPLTPTSSTPVPQQSTNQTPFQDVPILPHFSAKRESLTSSRPAPPSPAASRRASAALSRHSSSARSRRQSKRSSLSHQIDLQKHSSVLSQSSPLQANRRSWITKIRDFAFAKTDERHAGKGPDVPRPNRPRHRTSILSVSSSSSSTHDEADEDFNNEERQQAWGPFRWNTLSSHFLGLDKRGGPEAGPSRSDFERNFDASSSPIEDPEDDTFPSNGEVDEDWEDPDANEDEPLLPGLYRALYAFDPEGTAEMALEEDQVVKVVGRGGGVGWAIVEQEGGGHALVPESYLELIEADQD
ncbi:hypothetical protein NLI96_g10074 [Meripilus lineatus]|uniref:SH3 domain-containing protein n=1 Tax=Meripilus lineatus TaxID=2056292 RepID=A0AAD5YEM9_9APHY|nr:hypothetical protein NLI96_g10074 [Physisporinus lineatus]